MNNYELFYLVCLALAIFIYFYFFYSRYHNKKIVKDNMNQKEITRLILINLFILIPLIAYFYLKDYNYKISDNIKNLAYPIMLIALICIIKTSYDLGNEYSFTLQLRKDHKLVDTGIYKYIRHPMYFCGLLFIIAQSLLIPNIIGNISNLVSIYVFATGRIPDEEKMMIKEFGDKYRNYMKKTNSVIPFIL
jgi:protein-S-isoprenylcysteine O-methyltransferase Ste14